MTVETQADQRPKDYWLNRRKLIFRTVHYLGGIVLLALMVPYATGGDQALAQTVVTSAFTLAGAVILGYSGLASLERISGKERDK